MLHRVTTNGLNNAFRLSAVGGPQKTKENVAGPFAVITDHLFIHGGKGHRHFHSSCTLSLE